MKEGEREGERERGFSGHLALFLGHLATFRVQ